MDASGGARSSLCREGMTTQQVVLKTGLDMDIGYPRSLLKDAYFFSFLKIYLFER